MAEFNTNLWAPWRMEYIRSLREEEPDGGCFLCRYWAAPDADAAHHVVWRGKTAFACLNRFPYTNGHLLICHAAHKGDFGELSVDELTEMSALLRDGVALLRTVLTPHGFNIGYNLGRCAGAGLPGHLHAHIVPRWNGDTNFMPVLGQVRVIPDSLDAIWQELTTAAAALRLR